MASVMTRLPIVCMFPLTDDLLMIHRNTGVINSPMLETMAPMKSLWTWRQNGYPAQDIFEILEKNTRDLDHVLFDKTDMGIMWNWIYPNFIFPKMPTFYNPNLLEDRPEMVARESVIAMKQLRLREQNRTFLDMIPTIVSTPPGPVTEYAYL